MSSAASKQETHKYVDTSVTVFLYIKLQVSVQWITRDSKTSPEPEPDPSALHRHKQILTFVWSDHSVRLGWSILDSVVIFQQKRLLVLKEIIHILQAQKQQRSIKRKHGNNIWIKVETSSWVVTLTPATKTPSADFTTFLKKSSSFSFLFFPRTLSFWQQDMKKRRNMNNTDS